MNAVMLSIRPRYCELIASGKKTIEVRRTKPKIETPFKVYIYCTQYRPIDYINYGYGLNMAAGTVIGEFVCDCITTLYNVCNDDWNRLLGGMHEIEKQLVSMACMTEAELHKYANGKQCFAWRISDLKIYDEPKELKDFVTVDKEAIRQCEHRTQSYHAFTDTGYIKNGFGCDKKDDWCFGCKTKPIVRPPQSLCYVEERK